MGTSLIALIESGGSLKPVEKATLHYPQESFDKLQELEHSHFWFRSRRKVISYLLRQYIKVKVPVGLDIGCGTGINASCFSKADFPTVGIDAYDSFSKEKARGLAKGFIKGDIFSIEPESEFDFVMLLDVIEHIEKDSLFLNQSFKFLKPGGIMILTVPAFPSLWSKFDEDANHLRRYTKATMASVCQLGIKNGRIKKQFYYFGLTLPLYYLSRHLSAGKQDSETQLSSWLNRSLELLLDFELKFIRFGGLPFGSSLVCVLEKGE